MLRNITRLTSPAVLQSHRLVVARLVSSTAPALRRKNHKHDDSSQAPDLSHSSDTRASDRFDIDQVAQQQSLNQQGLGLGDQSTRKDPSMARPGEDDTNDRVRSAPTLQFDDSANRLNESRPSGEQSRQSVPGGAAWQAMGSEGSGNASVGSEPEWLRSLHQMPDLNAQDQSRRSNTDIGSESILAGGQSRGDLGGSSSLNSASAGSSDASEVHVTAGGTSRSSASIGAPGTEFTPDELYRPGEEQAKGSDYQGQPKSHDPTNIQARHSDAGMSQQSQQLGTSGRGVDRGDESRADINRQALGSQPETMTNPIAQAAETISQGLNQGINMGMEVMGSIRDTVKSILDPESNVDKNRFTHDHRDEARNRNQANMSRDEFADRSDRSGRNNN